MGIFLLIPGLIFLLNGTNWFSGENQVGAVLTVIGGVLFALQAIWFLFVASKVRKVQRQVLDHHARLDGPSARRYRR